MKIVRTATKLGCIAAKRLKAALPSLLNALERFNHPFIDQAIAQDLSHISASSIDRLLSFERKRLMPYEMQRLFAAPATPEWYIYAWRFLVVTGLRRGELCALQTERDKVVPKVKTKKSDLSEHLPFFDV